MAEKDIISFKDFLGNSLSSKSLEILSKIDFEEDDEIIDEENTFPEELLEESDLLEEDLVINENEMKDVEESTDDFYVLYSDRNENFVCDIHIEGANPEKSEVRLIVEYDSWNLMFEGSLENGKCTIPVKNLSMLQQGSTGKIKLEVIAEGNVFTPWENTYRVEQSKSVSVNFR